MYLGAPASTSTHIRSTIATEIALAAIAVPYLRENERFRLRNRTSYTLFSSFIRCVNRPLFSFSKKNGFAPGDKDKLEQKQSERWCALAFEDALLQNEKCNITRMVGTFSVLQLPSACLSCPTLTLHLLSNITLPQPVELLEPSVQIQTFALPQKTV